MRKIFSIVTTGAIAAAAVGASAWSQETFKPTVTINEVMVLIIDHNSHAIWDVAEDAPDNADDWHLLEHSALTLAASGNLITVGGTGPNDAEWVREAEWRTYSQAMTNAGLDALSAVRERDIEALMDAGDSLLSSCLGCHRQYKPELPNVMAQPHMHQP